MPRVEAALATLSTLGDDLPFLHVRGEVELQLRLKPSAERHFASLPKFAYSEQS